nr:immunoglobulin heavy chain junction region [Macaca mulatta]
CAASVGSGYSLLVTSPFPFW